MEMKNALAEDPTAFEYDTIYDHMKGPARSGRAESRAASTPLYIGNLLAKAEERKRQADLVYEKKLQRELEAEKELFGETEAFITPAYKEKLEENRRFEEEQRRKEEEDEKRQATGKKDMSSFYSNLMTKNVAFGAQGTPSPQAADVSAHRSDVGHAGRRRPRSRSPHHENRRHYSGDFEFERQREDAETTSAQNEAAAQRQAEAEVKRYAKRNVGQRFDDARERYFERVAARKAGSPVPAK
jgi:coiled-coil domain-containing protein 55